MSRGTMCIIDDAISYLRALQPAADATPERIINRLQYMRDKENGIAPKFHKGEYGRKYDRWTCGNCGATVKHGVLQNFCMNCGYLIKWENPRCLTGKGGDLTGQVTIDEWQAGEMEE